MKSGDKIIFRDKKNLKIGKIISIKKRPFYRRLFNKYDIYILARCRLSPIFVTELMYCIGESKVLNNDGVAIE